MFNKKVGIQFKRLPMGPLIRYMCPNKTVLKTR